MNDFPKLVLLIFGVFLIVFSLSGFLGIQMGASPVATIIYNSSPADNQTAVVPSKPATGYPTSAQGKATVAAVATATPATIVKIPTNTVITPFATLAVSNTQLATALLPAPYPPPNSGGAGNQPPPNSGGPGSSLRILGRHTVHANEYLYCIGRAYGVLPQSIAEVNSISLDSIIFTGQVLKIPDMPWVNMTTGPTCTPQFVSPYAPTPTPTTTSIASNTNHTAGHSYPGKEHRINFVLPDPGPESTDSETTAPGKITNPEPPVAETRIVSIELPARMHIGESSQVMLTFSPETGQSAITVTNTAQGSSGTAPNSPKLTETTYTPVEIPDVFDDYRIFAVAGLYAVGFHYSPEEDIEQEIIVGKKLTWRWSIKPEDTDAQGLIIKLRLVYKPRTDTIPLRPDEEVWNEAFSIDVTRNLYQAFFGAQANFFAAFSLIAGCIISMFSIWDKIPWRKRFPEKINSTG